MTPARSPDGLSSPHFGDARIADRSEGELRRRLAWLDTGRAADQRNLRQAMLAEERERDRAPSSANSRPTPGPPCPARVAAVNKSAYGSSDFEHGWIRMDEAALRHRLEELEATAR